MVLSIENLYKYFNGEPLLKDVNVTIEDNDRIGLIGRNGCGKSTLLKIITGMENFDKTPDGKGSVNISNNVTVGFLQQNSGLDNMCTIGEEMKKPFADLLEILEKATSLDDVLVIQSRITDVTYQLESYRSQLRKYDDLISYCTVHLNVNEVVELTEIKEPPKTVLERMSQGLADTWDMITDDTEDFAVGFVSALPLLVIWAIIIVLAVIVIKSVAAKRRKARVEKAAKDYEAYQAAKNKDDNETK